MRAERLLRLYPPAWRNRYREEFLATVGDGPLRLQQVIDIVSGAIDAWLSADVRRATMSSHAANGGGLTMLKSLAMCERKQLRYTTRDALIGAAVMIGVSLVFTLAAVIARRDGLLVTGEVLVNISFTVAWMLSMPFWLMKGQPWKAQVTIVGGTVTLLTALGYLASVT